MRTQLRQVRSGSKADIAVHSCDVRFTLRSRHERLMSTLPRFPDAAPCHLSTGCCEEMASCASPSTRKGISQVASFLPLSGHSGHGRNCCSLDPVAIDPNRSLAEPKSRSAQASCRTHGRRALRPAMAPVEREQTGVLVAFDILMEPKFCSSVRVAGTISAQHGETCREIRDH